MVNNNTWMYYCLQQCVYIIYNNTWMYYCLQQYIKIKYKKIIPKKKRTGQAVWYFAVPPPSVWYFVAPPPTGGKRYI